MTIVLRHARTRQETDDAGITILKSVLPSTNVVDPLYVKPTRKLDRLCRVPKLESFCIRVLIDYPEQMHHIGARRLRYSKTSASHFIRSLFPTWGTPHFSLAEIDPRLWAVVIQAFSNLPGILDSYPIHLSDKHLPLLQHIQSTPDFALVTILDLRSCRLLADDSILDLKTLHNLCALDVSDTDLTTRGLRAFSRSLIFGSLGERRGPWSLRALRMRNCRGIDGDIFSFINEFPLLCTIDLRRTSCLSWNVENPFKVTEQPELFDCTLHESVENLQQMYPEAFPCHRIFKLHVQERPVRTKASSPLQRARRDPLFPASAHNSFVVLPPSMGSARARPQFQFGNSDIVYKKEKEADKEERYAENVKKKYPDKVFQFQILDTMMEDPTYLHMVEFMQREREIGRARAERRTSSREHHRKKRKEIPNDDTFSNFLWDSEDDSDSALPYANRNGSDTPAKAAEDDEMSGWSSQDELPEHAENSSTRGLAVDNFYKDRPRASPPRLRHERITNGSPRMELTVMRTPPPWTTLTSLSPETKQYGPALVSVSGKPTETTKLQDKASDKKAVKAWQDSLAKRRNPLRDTSQPRFSSQAPTLINSPPPSPTLRSTPAIQPSRSGIESDQNKALKPFRGEMRQIPAIRHSADRRPRLRLEPEEAEASVGNWKPVSFGGKPKLKRTASFSDAASPKPSVTKRFRNATVKDLFKAQAEDKNEGPRKSEGSSKPSKPPSTAKSKSNASSTSKPKGQKSQSKASGFDWDAWRKG